MEQLQNTLQTMLRTKRRRRVRTFAFAAAALLAVLGVAYGLRQYGVAKTAPEKILACHYEAPQGPGYAGFSLHSHGPECFDTYGVLRCPLEEIELHTHDEDCFVTSRTLVCGQEESEGHHHTEECYAAVRGELICGLEENEEHTHTDECYAWTEELICGLEEGEGAHTHTDECYEVEQVAICGKPEITENMLHTHTEDCFDEDGQRICGMLELTEHVHGPECFVSPDEPVVTLEPSEESPTPSPVTFPAQQFEQTVGGITVRVEAPEGAFPAGTEMRLQMVPAEDVLDQLGDSVEGEIVTAEAVDISFFNIDGEEIEPLAPIRVEMSSDAEPEADGQTQVIHILDDGGTELVTPSSGSAEENAVSFEANSFSIYVFLQIRDIKTRVITADGTSYNITVSFEENAGIPETAELRAEEIPVESDAYQNYLVGAERALEDSGRVTFARFFDISILQDGQEIQPDGPVKVKIELADAPKEELKAVHFEHQEEEAPAEETAETQEAQLLDSQRVAAKVLDNAVSFETDSFSVYGVVTVEPLATATEIGELDGKTFYISIDDREGRFYFRDSLNGSCVAKTNVAELSSAALYTFEKVEGSENRFKVSTTVNGEKQYLCMGDTGTAFTFSPGDGSEFTVEQHKEPGSFYIYYLRSNGQKCAWTYTGNGFVGQVNPPADTNKVVLTEVIGKDPYGLDGKFFGIINNQDTVSGTAMQTGSAGSGTLLTGKTMTVRTEPIKRTENVFVAANSNITMWSFTAISQDRYYVAAEVSGALKFLSISESGVKLVDAGSIDDSCAITLEQGTGAYTGKFKFSSGDWALALDGSNFKAITDLTDSANNANAWMNLAELSNLKDDDFVVYSAEKVSVSGETGMDDSGEETFVYDVEDGDTVILYTRIWNDEAKRYEYYAVDYDGMLVRAYESGDTISWVGSKINTMLWRFTEYREEDGSPNYYYELQNTYSDKYIAPQVTGEGFLADAPIGINLNGRRNREYYTTVLAWDDPYYDYAALNVQDWQLTSAPIAKADTFYFARMKTAEEEQSLTQVETLDHTPYGITIKMQDYGNINSSNRSQTLTDVLGNTPYMQWTGTQNLLKKNLSNDGYPRTSSSAHSLGELFGEAMEVNHQFLSGTYRETGYFEYDCTQNFAHLITSASDKWYGQPRPDGGTYDIGDFVVYEQLGTSTEKNKDTLKHGQFFPYNDLEEGKFSQYLNERDIHANPLSSLDPRKGEKLYGITYKQGQTAPSYVDHFFGVEMSASFMQSESGLDEWGHDLIFEFSGDDDFWFYVDGKLVLDLGGIHSALDGSINFRTGEVIVNKKQTNLRDLYEAAYKEEHPNAAATEIEAWLDGIFKENENGVKTVFKDFSGHTMKMFYFERGAGASNLHMRFNLAPYTDGEVLLEKQVSGVEKVDEGMRFPFQIAYLDTDRPDDRPVYLTENNSVVDAMTGEEIPYMPTYTVGELEYQNVFLLKPGQRAAIRFPDENTIYWVQECGMNTDIYDSVTANGEALSGRETGDPKRMDYPVETSSVANRKQLTYNNHVSASAQNSLLITKRLWQDFEKTKELQNDEAAFRFRIYLGKEGDEYTVYNTGKYYVKNPEGFYCIFRDGGFVSTGKQVFSELSDQVLPGEWKSQRDQATFHTSPGGAADRIPAGYSVEIPGLMVGTPFFVLERDDEIPAGYHLIDYTREDAQEGEEPNKGVITDHEEEVVVHNQHGYGLEVKKVWSDADFMEYHDEICFAVYDKSTLELLPGSVRRLGKTDDSIRWFFQELEDGKTLNDYWVFEVQTEPKASELTVDPATGEVSGYTSITRVEQGGELTVGGETNEHGYSANFVYTAGYEREELTAEQIAANTNSRTDTVTNARPGIRLVKTDLEGTPLEGGGFTLVKSSDASTQKTFRSGEDGLIAVAYLTAGEDYVLTETEAPYRHLSLVDSLTIRVSAEGVLTVNGQEQAPDGAFYTVTQVENPTAENMPTVTVQNKPFALQALKVDAASGVPIPGVHFELFPEKMDSSQNPMPDYQPMAGFEQLVTGEDGVIPKINLYDLTPGVYYLHETVTNPRYKAVSFYIRLTITPTGQISAEKAEYNAKAGVWKFSALKSSEAEVRTDSDSSVTLAVKNTPTKGVRILKRSYITNTPLEYAEFALYKLGQVEHGVPIEGEEPLFCDHTDANGLLNLGALDANSTYYLFETKAPDGYQLLSGPIVITMTSSGSLTAMLNSERLKVDTVRDESGDDILQINVYNSNGYELPRSGGPGTALYTAAGGTVLLLGVWLLIRRGKKKKA